MRAANYGRATTFDYTSKGWVSTRFRIVSFITILLIFLVLYPLGLRAELGVVAAVGRKRFVGVERVADDVRGDIHR